MKESSVYGGLLKATTTAAATTTTVAATTTAGGGTWRGEKDAALAQSLLRPIRPLSSPPEDSRKRER